jgi:hypothetical protein
METPVRVCGRTFTPELIRHLAEMIAGNPRIKRGVLAEEVCRHLSWRSLTGRPALSSARVALRKLESRGLLQLPVLPVRASAPRRLRSSGQALPPVVDVPRRVDEVGGLSLYLVSGQDDARHGLWNELMVQQHPLADAPLVGTQLRYLIDSDHGCLGALGFGPASFVLGARDQWIGWSTRARIGHLPEVVCLSRLLIRAEVRCGNLVSKVWSMAVDRLAHDWHSRYGARPVLVETFVDRSRFTGRSLAAANWLRLGESTGRGRLGPAHAGKTPKDIWVYPLSADARQTLQQEPPEPVTTRPLLESLQAADWCGQELEKLDLGDARLDRRAVIMLEARWNDPSATFGSSFPEWADAKAAYNLIENKSTRIGLGSLLHPHAEATLARMAAEPVVLLPQDTTSLNYSGLRQTTGLGKINHEGSRGLFLHTLQAWRPDGVPLGTLDANSWGRVDESPGDKRTRNAKSIDEKESARWVEALGVAASAARRLPQTQIVVLADREGDLYEIHDGVQVGPPNLHVVIRAQHNRNLEGHQKLWTFMAAQPAGDRRELRVPRRGSNPARTATVEVRWGSVTIQAPAVGPKKGWPSLSLRAVWVHEPEPPPGIEPLSWMLLTDLPVSTAAEAWEKAEWYSRRWGIEEWHRVLKSICGVEQREFETAENLQRALTFDLIMAWRILALIKLGRAVPNVPASLLYTDEELEVLTRAVKKKPPNPAGQLTLQQANRMVGKLGGWLGRKGDGEPGAEKLATGLRRLHDMICGWRLVNSPASTTDEDELE